MGIEGYCTCPVEYGEKVFTFPSDNDNKKIRNNTSIQKSNMSLYENCNYNLHLINSNYFSINAASETARKWPNFEPQKNSNEMFIGRQSNVSCNNKNENSELYNDLKKTNSNILNLSNGDKYKGDIINNKPNGKGIYYSITGEIKEGTFIDGHLNGNGKMTLNNGFFLEGNFLDDELDGYGKTINLNGEMYEGEFKNNIREGKGKLILSNEDRLEGNFKKGKLEGHGKFISKNGESYDGEFIDGIPNGRGLKKYKDGSEFEGYFEKGKENIYGIKKWKDGQIYEGEFLNGIKNGIGKETFKNGQKFEGNFYEDQYNGIGVYLWPDGLKYMGEFKDNKIEGKGILTWSNGDKYEGYFIDGKYCGFGIETKIDGNKYEGYFKNDEYEGHGIKIYSNGEKYEGEFHKGNLHGKGKWSCLDGSSLEGNWNNGSKQGTFKKVSLDGKEKNIEFKNDEEIKEEEKNSNGIISIEINEEENNGGKNSPKNSKDNNISENIVLLRASSDKDNKKIINKDKEKNINIINISDDNGINEINNNSNINSNDFYEETFNEFTFILLTNLEAKKLNLEIAKEKFLIPIEDKNKLSSEELLDKIKNNIASFLNCKNKESLNDIHKWLSYLLDINNNDQNKMQEELINILSNVKEYQKEQEVFLTKKIKKYLSLKKDNIYKKLKSYNSKYISFLSLKTMIEEEQIELKEQYFVYLFYALKRFDDPEASLNDLKYEILFDIINDENNDSKMEEESDLEISDDEYNQIIINFQLKLLNYINNNHTNLRLLLNGLIQITSFGDENNIIEVVLIKPFFERMKEIGIWQNNDLEIYCIFNRYKLSEKYEGINICLLEDELKKLKIDFNSYNNSNENIFMENIKEENEENSLSS